MCVSYIRSTRPVHVSIFLLKMGFYVAVNCGNSGNCGNLLTVTRLYSNGHKNIWSSQPLVNQQSDGNIKCSAPVLLSANTYMRMA